MCAAIYQLQLQSQLQVQLQIQFLIYNFILSMTTTYVDTMPYNDAWHVVCSDFLFITYKYTLVR